MVTKNRLMKWEIIIIALFLFGCNSTDKKVSEKQYQLFEKIKIDLEKDVSSLDYLIRNTCDSNCNSFLKPVWNIYQKSKPILNDFENKLKNGKVKINELNKIINDSIFNKVNDYKLDSLYIIDCSDKKLIDIQNQIELLKIKKAIYRYVYLMYTGETYMDDPFVYIIDQENKSYLIFGIIDTFSINKSIKGGQIIIDSIFYNEKLVNIPYQIKGGLGHYEVTFNTTQKGNYSWSGIYLTYNATTETNCKIGFNGQFSIK